MNIKQILAGAALLLPFAVTSIPSQASAFQVIVNPHGLNRPAQTIAQKPQQVRHSAPPAKKKVLVPGHWEKTNHGRKWVAAHYVYK
ncbi:MAG: hypothetical protein V7L14_29205 [Nostoc sp.]|uniref:hypothetical protein n=1 Tax=unclassified Nostoc TaxID=2593658 RepID=UPI0025F652B8|nr:hypothetical protein [Nostoc sp. NOS(2021)]MBN3899327.1 hypothetical protein [Nostoc sp. NOS(2021)]